MFDRAGTYVGEVRLPDRLQDSATGFAFADGVMAAFVFDEMGTHRVKVWRILPSN